MPRWIGRKFGKLKVRFSLERDEHRQQYFCCQCDCGATVSVRGAKLISGQQKSCGCLRGDPKVRHEARMKVPAKKRLAISRKGSAASAKIPHRSPFALDAHRAAELLGVSPERVEIMATDGLLGSKRRNGALWVSAEDVASVLAEQCRQQKRCKLETKSIFGAEK